MHLTPLMRLRRRLAADDGFSMLGVIFLMVVTSMFVAGGFAAANGDLPVARDSQDRKAAYAAAESGVNFYQFHLDADNDYWLDCETVPAPNATEASPVNQPWDGSGLDPRRWRKVTGSEAEYTLELLPAKGAKCVKGDVDSMIDPKSGTFRVRSTGRPKASSKLRRTINATFRRRSFLDFLYFTDFETLDPMAYSTSGTYNNAWAALKCADRVRAVRNVSGGGNCEEIRFVTVDTLNGPMHTNDDSILVCGNPTFGRSPADQVGAVAGGKTKGWIADTGCSGSTPNFKSPFNNKAETLTLPPTNAALKTIALNGGYVFKGKTIITFKATGGMTVTNPYVNGGAAKDYAMPGNGVIYVEAGTCGTVIPPIQATYTEGPGCAKAYVSGTYTADTTIASADDIIIKQPDDKNANGTDKASLADPMLVNKDDEVLGLIAENYVRVYHKVSSDCNSNVQYQNSVTIEAAILSLKHSFIVDNWRCGPKLTTPLRVIGAIGQKYRGPVGTGSNGVTTTGYAKDYNYDDRLHYRSPPYFLDPVAASWHVIRMNEQVPPTK
jgi:hypothetical protein